jgi:hypothetical protein
MTNLFDSLIKKADQLYETYINLPEHNDEAYKAYKQAHDEAMVYSNKVTIGGKEF